MKYTAPAPIFASLAFGLLVSLVSIAPLTAHADGPIPIATSPQAAADSAPVPPKDITPIDDEDFYAVPARPVLRHHLILPSSAPTAPGQQRSKPKLRVAAEVRPDAVKTGTGIVYTCDSSVPASTCTYLNTTVAGYYNNIFLNANANIYIKFGTTGLGGSDGFINLVHYTPYVTAMTNKAVKSSNQASALSNINTYATPAYGTQNIMGISVALGTALGFTGLIGINAAESASCTPYTSGCYNEVITVADSASQASGGFSFYYDDQGGTEAAGQYDFYAVVEHETDEVLGTSSCISTQNTSGLTDECDGPVTGSNGIPSTVDLLRFSSPGKLALNTTPSTAAGQYYSFDGGAHYGAYGDKETAKVYNTLDNGDDFADYISSSPDCGTNQAVQDAEGCPGEDAGLTILNDGQSEITILNTDGFDIPEAAISSPAPGSTLSGSSATFTWSAVPGATDYWVYVGTTGVGSSNIFSNTAAITATSQAVSGLPTSGKIYVRVYSFVGGFWTSRDFSYTGGSTSSTTTVTLSPTSIPFGKWNVGSQSNAVSVTLKNTGTVTLNITGITLSGANPTNFLKTATTCGTTLAASASCTISVAFHPTAAQAYAANLSIADNATGTPQLVTLGGTGVVPLVPVIALSATTLTFPNTITGTTSDAQIVTVNNTGTAAASLTSIVLGGTNPTGFELLNGCGTSLAAATSCSFYVAFKPASAAAFTATVSVTDNASGSPQKVTLTGTGTADPVIKFSVATLAFPTTTHLTTSAPLAVTITNSGTSSVELASITITGTNPTDFIEINTCATSLAAGASCTAYVAFAPAAVASYSAKLTVADSGASSPQTVTLTCTGK